MQQMKLLVVYWLWLVIPPIKAQQKKDSMTPTHGIFMYMFGGLLVASLIRYLIRRFSIPVPYATFILILGLLWGVGALYSKTMLEYCGQVYPAFSRNLLFAYMPVIIFKMSFCIDVHTFLKSLTQILIISIPVTLLSGCMIGLLMRLVIDNSWPIYVGILFGILCNPIYPMEVVHLLKEIGNHTKHIRVLLEGESLVAVETALLVNAIILGVHKEVLVHWYQMLMTLLRYVVLSIPMGYIFGILGCLLMKFTSNDPTSILAVTLAIPFVSFYVCEVFIATAGLLCVLIVGIKMGIERTSLSAETDQLLISFWKVTALIMNTVIFLSVGPKIMLEMINWMHLKDYVLILVTYLVANVCRFLSFLLFAPILSRIGYGLSFRDMTICVWACLKNPITLALTMRLKYMFTEDPETARTFLIHIVGLFLVTLIINGSFTPLLFKTMGLLQVSLAKQINMNNCIKHVLARRERAIAVLKMDRFLSDANWLMVNTDTILKHPYKIDLTNRDVDDEYFMGFRFTVCPDCQKDIIHEPTSKEFEEMTREARLRILKAKKISYARQYECGMISKEGIRILTQAVEVAMDTKEALVELDGLYKLFKKEGFFYRCMRNRVESIFMRTGEDIKPPRKYWRRLAFRIVLSKSFITFIYLVILINCFPICLAAVYRWPLHSIENYGLVALTTVFLLIYISEFYLKILAYSWIYICRHGFHTYFKSAWNILDFIVLFSAIADATIMYLQLKGVLKLSETVAHAMTAVELLRVIRLFKLIRYCRGCYPRLIQHCDSRIDSHKAFAYDVGKGYVTGEEEVLEMLPYMIDNEKIKEDMRERMEQDRLAVTKLLGMVQKDRPWIAITVKTKQAIKTVLNSMKDAINELKVSGWVDDVEYAKLMESLGERYKYVSSIKSVQPSAPKVIFNEVPWMAGEEKVIHFLYENVVTKKYDPGDKVCVEGQVAEGIYVVVTGLLMLSYTPRGAVLRDLNELGCLPIVDYISSVKFDEELSDYIVSGNCIGELSVLTGRAYNCTVTADTHSQVYLLTDEIIKRAMEMSSDPINGLECRIWRSVSIRIAIAVLMDVPAYQSSTQDKIKYALERAFMPKLTNYKTFVVNDMMEDIILIEGLIVDYNTRDIYTGPCYIPRTVQRLMFPKNSNLHLATHIETRLLIIPAKDADEYDIMLEEEEICEMVSAEAKQVQNLVHDTQSKLQRRRPRGILHNRRTLRSNTAQGVDKGKISFRKFSDSAMIDYLNTDDVNSVQMEAEIDRNNRGSIFFDDKKDPEPPKKTE